MPTATYQRNALDTSYNGWENWTTWNIALWINNNEYLYNLALEIGNYVDFVEVLKDCGVEATRDGARFDSDEVNIIQLNSDLFDI